MFIVYQMYMCVSRITPNGGGIFSWIHVRHCDVEKRVDIHFNVYIYIQYKYRYYKGFIICVRHYNQVMRNNNGQFF